MRVAITGANRGIGFELVRSYQRGGDEVLAICRRASAELRSTGAQLITGVDVSAPAAVDELTRQIGSSPLDVLVNNAGILEVEEFTQPGWDQSIRRQFEVNALGPLRVTRALLPSMRSGAKIAILSSRVGSIADNGSGGYYGYRMSKVAVNMAGVNLAHELKDREIAVFLLHPGLVRTEMTAGGGSKDASTAARELVDLISRLTLAETGTFWHAEGYPLPW
jgi:NAD(P)-dependent dehydrogenase (short-subunit alcohol dehydrogenase family)